MRCLAAASTRRRSVSGHTPAYLSLRRRGTGIYRTVVRASTGNPDAAVARATPDGSSTTARSTQMRTFIKGTLFGVAATAGLGGTPALAGHAGGAACQPGP